jgi:hypothetical protein
MNENELHKMYQAWCQGNEHYARDWVDFVEWCAKWNRTTGDAVMRELQKYYWFIKDDKN